MNRQRNEVTAVCHFVRLSVIFFALLASASMVQAPAIAASDAKCLTPVEVSAAATAKIFADLGAKGVTTVEMNDGGAAVQFSYDGVFYTVGVILCDPAFTKLGNGCLGLMLVAAIKPTDGEKYETATVNAFNVESPTATAMLWENGNIILSRFLFTAGGISRENLVANFELFTQAPPRLLQFLKTPRPTAQLQQLGAPRPSAVAQAHSVTLTAQDFDKLMSIARSNARPN